MTDDDLLLYNEEQRVARQGKRKRERDERDMKEWQQTKLRAREEFDEEMITAADQEETKKRKTLVALTAHNTATNAGYNCAEQGGNYQKRKEKAKAKAKAKKNDLKQLLEEEKKEKERQEKLQSRIPYYSHVEYSRPIKTSLEEEGIQFAQLTRPSRNQLYHQLLPDMKEQIDDGDLLFFLLRPLNVSWKYAQLPEHLSQNQVIWSMEQVGVKRGWICRLPGRVIEYMLVLFLEDVRHVPTKEDPLLRIDPNKAYEKFDCALAPMLIEQINGITVTPCQLLSFDSRLTRDKQFSRTPHQCLHRNATHKNKSKRVVKAILDSTMNLVPMDGLLADNVQLSFEKSKHLGDRPKIFNVNTNFGMHPCWTNVILDYKALHKSNVNFSLNYLTSTTHDIADVGLNDKGESISNEYYTYECYTCFAESKICTDSTGSCRFYRWNKPGYNCSLKPAY